MMMGGMETDPYRTLKISHYFMLLRLLQLGIPYDEIFRLTREEINYFLTIGNVIEERKAEQSILTQ